MKPSVFLDKSLAYLKRKLRVRFYTAMGGQSFSWLESTGSEEAEPRLHTAEGILLKGGYVLLHPEGSFPKASVDSTFCLPVNYARGNGRLMFLSIREYFSKRNSLGRRKSTELAGQFFLPPHIWSDNYYHFLVEVLPAVHWAMKETQLQILIPAMKPFFRRFFDHFGWDWQSRVIVYDPGVLFHGQFSGLTNIRIIRKGRYTLPNPSLLSFYRGMSVAGRPDAGTVLIVSRARTGDRRILNEDEMIAYLSVHFNCEVLVPERQDFLTQVEKIRNASVIIGSHGAGLTNALFHAGLKCMVEVSLKEKVNESYISLCEAMGVQHRLLLVEGAARDSKGPMDQMLPLSRRSFNIGMEDLHRLKSWVEESMTPLRS